MESNTPNGFTLEGTPEHERLYFATKNSMKNAIDFNERQKEEARRKYELNKEFPEPPKYWEYEQ